MLLDILSRAQFAFTITFHILFPAFSIGLVTFIAVMEAVWLKTKNPHYRNICKFWTKVLALTFGMGIVSGIVMEFQLGTNWSKFTHAVGNVLGVLFTYEVLTAFFIEAGFLGVMFFGWNRVSPRLHFIATLLALIGVTLSAFWIMSANSWMQTPSGFSYANGIFTVTSWWHVIFNPSFILRYLHMMVATYIAAFLVIAAVSAFYLLKNKYKPFAKTCLSFVMWAIIFLIPVQIVLGDEVGLVIHEYQPLKTAAMEGLWETENGAPLVVFGIPSQKDERNYYEITIPRLASFLNTHHMDGQLVGLKSVAASERPPVGVVFWSFRIMVGLGLLIFFAAVIALILRMKNQLYDTRWFLISCLFISPLGFICIITGWFTAEFGRQPWVVYNYLRTANAHSPVQLYQVLISLASIILVYGIIFGFFYFRYFFRIIQKGPEEAADQLDQAFFYMAPGMVDKTKK